MHRVAGIYIGQDKKEGELTYGKLNSSRYYNMEFFHSYDYNGLWEMKWNSIGYNNGESHLRTQKGILMLNHPFIIFPISKSVIYFF